MTSGNTTSGGAQSGGSKTGVSDEMYDLMVTLVNTLQELWRVEEFAKDSNRSRDKQLWETIRDHDREEVATLVQALKREFAALGGSGRSQ
jgi:hypothetical protein